jgi:hypothetical protein
MFRGDTPSQPLIATTSVEHDRGPRRAEMPTAKRYPEGERLVDDLRMRMFGPPLSDRWRDRAAVPQPLRNVLLVIAFDTEVQMEGILGFLENSTGAFLPETIEAFRTIGATKTADVLVEIANIMRAYDVTHDKLQQENMARPLYDISSFRETHGRAANAMADRITEVARRLDRLDRDDRNGEAPFELLNAYAADHLTEIRRLISLYESAR